VGGTPEVVRDGETGVLVCPGNGTLERALCVLAADGKARQLLGEGARRWVREHLSLEVMVASTEQVLQGKSVTE